MIRCLVVACIFLSVSCAKPKRDTLMNRLATDYVKLVLKIGQYDADYIDAYFGPEPWKPKGNPRADSTAALSELLKEARTIQQALQHSDTAGLNDLERRRHGYLTKQMVAVEARIRMLLGEKFTFDQESLLLYDAVAPTFAEAHFEKLLRELDKAVPGKGELAERVEVFKQQFAIPPAKLDTVFSTAIAEGRKRTTSYITLPENESFVVEYVKDKPWSGYNWYKGNSHSVIQVNTDFPITIDRAVDLACHEGYPGHHVYNLLLEKNLAVDRGWPEFKVYVLFSPQSFIAEGSANYGIDAAFPSDERIRFETEVLFPLAGLDASKAVQFYEVLALTAKLNYAGNEAARRFLNGVITREEAVQYLVRYNLSSRARAEQRLRFIEKYRSYVINYNWGLDLVRNHIEMTASADHEARWRALEELLSKPHVPSELSGDRR